VIKMKGSQCLFVIIAFLIIVLISICTGGGQKLVASHPVRPYAMVRQVTPHQKKIPRQIYLTYKTKNSIPTQMIQRLQNLNPNYDINVYGDAECIHFLKSYFSHEYAAFFQNKIKDGPIKADFWRACVIYMFGGVYLDADVHLDQSLDDIIANNVTFCTSGSVNNWHVNPIILAATPKSPVIKDCIEYMYELRNSDYSYWKFSICAHLKKSIEKHIPTYVPNKSGFFKMKDGNDAQMFTECKAATPRTFWYDNKILDNHSPEIYDNHKHAFN